MGDRGNICIREAEGAIFLYTHWGGSEIAKTAQKSLKRGTERWDDPAYLTRIVFDDMVDGDRGTSGFGISRGICDNEYPIVVLDTDKQQVRFEDEKGRKAGEWSFTDYAAMDAATLDAAFDAAK